jgi:lysophospholipase L1-like esterase
MRYSLAPLVVIGLLGWFCGSAQGADTLLPQAKKILFLGDSITHAGTHVDLIEAYFVTRYPERSLTFLNLGLPSETVSGLSEAGHAGGKFPRPVLHERLERVLTQTKPDLVIACYGMNDGIYLPFAEDRFASFSNGIVKMHAQVVGAGAKIIHVTPPVFDEVKGKGPGYGATLDRYADWLLDQREAGWDVIDLHGPMKQFLSERRQTDPKYFLAGDGVHPGPDGHWILAQQILLHLGAPDLGGIDSAAALLAGHPHGDAILKLVQQKQRLLKDAWLNQIGHKRPGMNRGLPVNQAEVQARELEVRIRELAKP